MMQAKGQTATHGIGKFLLIVLLIIVILLILKSLGVIDFSLMSRSWELITKTFGSKP